MPFDEMAIVVRAPESYWGPIEQALRARQGAGLVLARHAPARIRPAAPSWRSSPAPPTTCRRAASPSTCRSARCRGAIRRPAASAPEPPPLVASRDDALAPGPAVAARPAASASDDRSRPRSTGAPARPRAAEPSSAPTCARRGAGSRCSCDAAVASEAGPTGRAARWHRRLGGLRAELAAAPARSSKSDEPGSGRAAALARDLAALDDLRSFALPLVDELAALPARARVGRVARSAGGARAARAAASRRACSSCSPICGRWRRSGRSRSPRCAACCCRAWPSSIASRRSIASAASSSPRRTRCAAAPSASSSSSASPSASSRNAAARIRCCSTRCAAPSARRWPSRTIASPAERVRLRLAVGAATERCWLSYPRLDVGQARARVPSFYALDVVRASTGAVPDHVRFERDTGDRHRRVAGVAGARRARRRRSTSGSTTSRCSAACCAPGARAAGQGRGALPARAEPGAGAGRCGRAGRAGSGRGRRGTA